MGNNTRSIPQYLALSESNDVRGISCTRMLGDEDFGARHRVDGGVATMHSLSDREHSMMLGVPKARHPGRQQAQKHLSRAISTRLAKPSICNIFRVAREVSTR